jgi:DNA-binding transcriptional MerR regulator
MTAAPSNDAPEGLLTIDELSAEVGMTVRNTRYYASLGLMPPPIKRGRVAYYGAVHRARLELVRALQQHGFTLQAIEGFVRTIPDDATVEQLALQRAMLTSWTPKPPEELTRRQLEQKAGRRLSADDLRLLVVLGSVQRRGKSYVALPHLEVGLGLLDLDVPEESLDAAGEAIRRHMEALVEELTDILRTSVLQPFREHGEDPEEAERLEQTLPRLRQLTLEAVVAGFQQAANAVITRSLGRD